MAKLIHTFNRSYGLLMSPDGKLIAQTNSTQINLFDTTTFEQVAQFKDIPNAKVIFSSDSKRLLAKAVDRKLGLYDLEKQVLLHKHSIKKNSQSQDYSICFSDDNKKIIDLVYSDDLFGYIAVWDIETWNESRFFESKNNVFTMIVGQAETRNCFVSGFHRTSADYAHTTPFYMWFDVESGKGDYIDTDFANSEKLMYADKSNTIFAYSGAGKKDAAITFLTDKRVIQLGDSPIHMVALSPDNKNLAIMFQSGATVFTFPDIEPLAAIDTQEGFGSISFSPDGKKLLVGTWKNGFLYELDL